MMAGFIKTFPYATGTFVITDQGLGTIACYQCVDEDDDDEFVVMVSGYKSSWCGEYLLSEIRLAIEEEISNGE